MAASKFLPQTGRCHYCGAILKYAVSDSRNLYYCSIEHMHLLPPRLARACQQYDKPARDLLLWAVEGRTITAAAMLLGADKQALYKWLRLYHIRREVQWICHAEGGVRVGQA